MQRRRPGFLQSQLTPVSAPAGLDADGRDRDVRWIPAGGEGSDRRIGSRTDARQCRTTVALTPDPLVRADLLEPLLPADIAGVDPDPVHGRPEGSVHLVSKSFLVFRGLDRSDRRLLHFNQQSRLPAILIGGPGR